jgi:hypothetical protein
VNFAGRFFFLKNYQAASNCQLAESGSAGTFENSPAIQCRVEDLTA